MKLCDQLFLIMDSILWAYKSLEYAGLNFLKQ